MPPALRSPSSAARVVYTGIVASTLIITGGALTMSLTLGTATMAAGLLDWVALISGSAALVTGFQQRKRLSQPGGGRSAEEWWTQNAGRALVVWGLLELGAVIGAVLLFATGRLPAYAVLAGLALAGLVFSSPSRLAGE